MSLLEIIRFAIRGLSINRLRTFLTTLGIMIGVMSVIVLIAVGNGSAKSVQQSLDRLGTNSITIRSGASGGFGPRSRGVAANTKPLTVANTYALMNKTLAPDIKHVAPIQNANATCAVGANTTTPGTFVGTWPSYFEISNTPLQTGSYFSVDDVTQGRRVADIGQTTATALFGTDNPIGKVMKCGGIPFTIVGLTAVQGSSGFQDGDSLVIAPLTAVQSTLTGASSSLSNITAEAASSTVTTQAQAEIDTVMDQQHQIHNVAKRDYSTSTPRNYL